MNTHDIGPVFWMPVRLRKHTQRISSAPTFEIEEPFRVSPKSLVVRFCGGRGLVLGRWYHSGMDETEALQQAIDASEIDLLDSSGSLLPEFDAE